MHLDNGLEEHKHFIFLHACLGNNQILKMTYQNNVAVLE